MSIHDWTGDFGNFSLCACQILGSFDCTGPCQHNSACLISVVWRVLELQLFYLALHRPSYRKRMYGVLPTIVCGYAGPPEVERLGQP